MTDNTKEKASKAEKAQKVSDKSSKKMLSDVTSSLDQLQHPGAKAAEAVKTGAHKAVSDVKTAAHEAGSKLKKKK